MGIGKDDFARPAEKRHGLMTTVLWAFGDRRLLIAGLWLLGLASIALSLVLPSQVGRLTQLFAGGEQVTLAPVLWAVAYLVGAQLALSAISYLRARGEVSLRQSGIRRLTMNIYARILRFGADFFRSQEVARINARAIEDANLFGMFSSEALIGIPLTLASVGIFAAVMLADNWLLGLCMILLSAFSGYFVLLDRRIQSTNFQVRETWEAIRASANEAVSGVSEIRNHAAFDYALANLGRSFRGYQTVTVRMGRLTALLRAADPLVGAAQQGVLFAVGAALCIAGSRLADVSGQITWGHVIKFMLLAQLFQGAVSQLAGHLLGWRMTRESGRRIGEFFARPCAFDPAAPRETLPEGPIPVAYERVSVAAESGRSILRDVSLEVDAGRHVALCGPSGCGKSTLIQAMVRGVEPTSGRCLLASVPLDRIDLASVARRVGFVPQTPVLFNTTIRQNLLLALRRPGERCLHDEFGPIDLSRLDHVQDAEDLDRELIAVARLAGLESDLVSKCLDGSLPKVPSAETIRSRVETLRSRIGRAVACCPPDLIIRFDPLACFPGTVAENLFGPGAQIRPAPVVFAWLASQPVMNDLVRIGYRRMIAEAALAARISHERPGLMELLPRREAPNIQLNVATTADGLPEGLSDADRQALAGAALDADLDLARQLAGSTSFDERLLAARNAIAKQHPDANHRWSALQEPAYVDTLSLRDNLLGGRPSTVLHGSQERIERLIHQALKDEGLLDTAILLGMEFVVGEGGKFLSGGQRQKVAIARVVLKRPSLLLLDEATASLDEASQEQVLEMVRTRFAADTVMSIAHRLDTIRDYDAIVVMDRGQIVQKGGYEDLARQDGVFRRLARQERGEPVAEHGAPLAATEEATQELQHSIAMSSVFGRLRSEQLAFLVRVMKISRCNKDEVLFRRGDPGREVFVILSGQVEFFVERGGVAGKTLEVVNTLGPGSVFGELAVFGRGRRTLGARAATAATLGVLDREDLLKLIHADPTIAIELLSTVSNRLARATDVAAAA